MARSMSNSRKKSVICPKCGTEYPKHDTYFNKSYSKKYGAHEFMPICKSCIYTAFEEMLRYYDYDTVLATKRFCMAYDVFYDDGIYKVAESKMKNVTDYNSLIGEYLKNRNLVQYRNKTFDVTLDRGFIFDKYCDPEERELNKVEEPVTIEEQRAAKKKDIIRWGDGFSPDDYKMMNDHYKQLIDANPNIDSNQEIFIDELCRLEMLKRRALVENKIENYNKISQQYIKTWQEAKLKTKAEKNSNENETLGIWAQRISEYTPEEYYKDKNLYKDFDNVGSYYERFVKRPLRNLQFGTNDRDEEFFVPNDEESIESIEDSYEEE